MRILYKNILAITDETGYIMFQKSKQHYDFQFNCTHYTLKKRKIYIPYIFENFDIYNRNSIIGQLSLRFKKKFRIKINYNGKKISATAGFDKTYPFPVSSFYFQHVKYQHERSFIEITDSKHEYSPLGIFIGCITLCFLTPYETHPFDPILVHQFAFHALQSKHIS